MFCGYNLQKCRAYGAGDGRLGGGRGESGRAGRGNRRYQNQFGIDIRKRNYFICFMKTKNSAKFVLPESAVSYIVLLANVCQRAESTEMIFLQNNYGVIQDDNVFGNGFPFYEHLTNVHKPRIPRTWVRRPK